MRKIISRPVSGLQWRLLLLAVLAHAPLVGLTVHTASDELRRLVEDWNQRAQEMMQLATREEGQVIGQTRQLLLALAESAPVLAGQSAGLQEIAGRPVQQQPALRQFGGGEDPWNRSGQRAADDGAGQPNAPSVFPSSRASAFILFRRDNPSRQAAHSRQSG